MLLMKNTILGSRMNGASDLKYVFQIHFGAIVIKILPKETIQYPAYKSKKLGF